VKALIKKIISIFSPKKPKSSCFMAENAIYKKHQIGEMTYGYPKIYDYNDNTGLSIGKYCSFADNVQIFIGGEHHSDYVTTYPLTTFLKGDFNIRDKKSKGNVKIGNDVWVANNVTILSGIKIGDGAILGAGSVITKDVNDYEVVAGNPAKHIRYRFSEHQINNLKVIAWWNWDKQKIQDNYSQIMSNNIDLFIDKHSM
jgi:acetyltransferase-like isoleucine patch superfamily enzyme